MFYFGGSEDDEDDFDDEDDLMESGVYSVKEAMKMNRTTCLHRNGHDAEMIPCNEGYRKFKIVDLTVDEVLEMAKDRLDVFSASKRGVGYRLLRLLLKNRSLIVGLGSVIFLLYLLRAIMTWYAESTLYDLGLAMGHQGDMDGDDDDDEDDDEEHYDRKGKKVFSKKKQRGFVKSANGPNGSGYYRAFIPGRRKGEIKGYEYFKSGASGAGY